MSALDFFHRRRARKTPAHPVNTGIFKPAANCHVVARAHRVALLIDGEDYFRAFMHAAEQATRSIVILAWDFNSNAELCFDDDCDKPTRLGDFLNWLVRRRRGLHIHILDWDYPLVFGTDREFRAPWGFGWRPHRRVHLAYDNTHPVGASHHQKIVVIDDSLAFIGGLDLTVRRWDSCRHDAVDERRQNGGSPYPPFHDLMMAVDGPAAHALGEVARKRWHAATLRHLPKLPPLPAPWPTTLAIDLREIDVAVARTLPGSTRTPPVVEVERLYLDMIAAAKTCIYVENQYFTAHQVGEALAASLAAPTGPEIIVVVRCFSHGWLEEYTMHVLRARLVRHLREADRHGRFHLYYPHRDGLADGTCIDLHSKLMIVDDEILRIGSSNLSNRSMGTDSECDAAFAANGQPEVARVIAGFRNRLLAEHLGSEPAAVAAAVLQHGSLHGAIAELGGGPRTLRKLEELPEWSQAMIDIASIGDPLKPVSVAALIDEFSPEQLGGDNEESAPAAGGRWQRLRPRILRFGAIVAVLALLAGLWRYTPLSGWIEPAQVTAWAHDFADRHAWAPLVILFAYTPACLVMFPRSLITLAAVVAFGPFLGFAYALTGILISALVTFLAGRYIPRRQVRKMAGKRLLRVADRVRQRGLLAMTALRLVPIAPFAVINVVAAAIGVHLVPFLLGTLFGMLPGTLAATIFGDQIGVALSDFSRVNYGAIAAAVVGIGLLTLAVRRWFVVDKPHGNAGQRTR